MRGQSHHIDFTVTDCDAARPIYDLFLTHMGYAQTTQRESGETHSGLNGNLFPSVGIIQSSGDNSARTHDRRSPGLHHAAWRAESKEDVDALHAKLIAAGVTVLDPPDYYYGPRYYAVFFADPDGLKLEYVWTPLPAQS